MLTNFSTDVNFGVKVGFMSIYFFESSFFDEKRKELKEYVLTEHFKLAYKFIYFELEDGSYVMVIGSNVFNHEALLNLSVNALPVKGIFACGTIGHRRVIDWCSSGLRCFIRTPKNFQDKMLQMLGV